VALPGIENAWYLGRFVYVGDGPPSTEAMAILRRQHRVLTLISLDAAPPDQAAALANLQNYVHVPTLAGRLSPAEYDELIGALATHLGAFYIHAGPGDPRAFAPAAMALNLWEGRGSNRALLLLDRMGLPRGEVGHWYDATTPLADRTMKNAFALPEEYPYRADDAPLVEWMREFDGSFRSLRAAREYGWLPAPEAIGTTPAFDARTIARNASDWLRSHPSAEDDFRARMETLRANAAALDEALGRGDKSATDAAWLGLAASCQSCHEAYRDKE
jgi:hypothetical protein